VPDRDVLAEPPSTTPNYIWPFAPSADFSDINTWNLQNLIGREPARRWRRR
jgi:hypothetical protein